MEIQILAPTPGQDYPRTWNEFLDWFATEEACLTFLEKLRWPHGFICPRCGNTGDVYRASRTRLMCRACQYQGTVTSGTIFDKTRTPLRVWLAAAWYLTNQKQGVSALGLQRVLGLGSYQTAWTMLHRFRRAMVRPGRDKLKGLVEVDETYLSITDRKKPITPVGRKSSTTKVLVAMAVEVVEPKGFGRIRLRRIARDSASYVVPFVQEVVEPGTHVRTDGSAAYRALEELGYTHQRTVMLGSGVPAHVSMAGVHRVASLVQRWVLGTHHGSVQPEHLDAYLDEFGKGDTSICGYYDTMSSSHPKCSYYKAASDICRGNNGLVNTAVNSGITAAWTAGSTSDSQATILEKIRKSLVASDKKARSEGRVDCNTDCVYGDDIDEYHNEAFNNAGLSKNFYGGNLWPQGVWPNPVPYDKRRLMDSLPKGPVEMPTWE